MKLIDLDAFWQYVRSHKINFGKYQHDLLNRQPTVQAVPLSVLQEIRQEIIDNPILEGLSYGSYDVGVRQKSGFTVRNEVIAIIDKHIKEIEGEDLGDYPDTIQNQFDNMTGSMNL